MRISKKLPTAAAIVFMAATLAMPASAATLLGPSSYTGAGDSPFNSTSFSQFYLEDFQDGLLNTPGLVSTSGAIFIGLQGTSVSDSVEFTPQGASYFTGARVGLTFSFDAAVLGGLPTHAGLVWTDGGGLITFEAFDQNGNSLGTLTGNHADNEQTGQTEEDRFYGAINASGISRISIRNEIGGIEADHVQYGLQNVGPGAVPEPSTWALMLLGFGAIGAALRRRQSPALRAA